MAILWSEGWPEGHRRTKCRRRMDHRDHPSISPGLSDDGTFALNFQPISKNPIRGLSTNFSVLIDFVSINFNYN